jgi:hypothetical protein
MVYKNIKSDIVCLLIGLFLLTNFLACSKSDGHDIVNMVDTLTSEQTDAMLKAEAIAEHYLPKRAGAEIPAGEIGALLGLADRIDSLAGFFGIGKLPSGNADPFGLRRISLAVLHLIAGKGYRLSLYEVIHKALALYGGKVDGSGATVAAVRSFLKGRFTQKPVKVSELREVAVFDFPMDAVRELLMNAVLHRDYQSTSPVRLYQFSNRIEIQNPGGLFGEASPENFPRVNAYRNPIVAEAMHVLGYVNRFGRGIARAKRALLDNGSAEPSFDFQTSHFLATIPKHPQR